VNTGLENPEASCQTRGELLVCRQVIFTDCRPSNYPAKQGGVVSRSLSSDAIFIPKESEPDSYHFRNGICTSSLKI